MVKKAVVKKKPAAKPKAKAKPKAAPAKPIGGEAIWADYWKKPDPAQLRVYADALEQAGDPRGTFIQLSLLDGRTEEQDDARERLMNKNKGDLIGPAKTFIREVEFGSNGLVEKARCEANLVIAGIAEISKLNPRLILTITSMKTEKLAKDFGKISLRDIYFVDFGWLISSHGGCRLTDKLLAAITPALAEVEHLQLSFSQAHNSPTPEGLRQLGQYAKKLKFLAGDYPTGQDLAPASAYAAAIREGFPALKAVEWPSMLASDLPGKKVNKLIGSDDDINGILREDPAAKVQSLFA